MAPSRRVRAFLDGFTSEDPSKTAPSRRVDGPPPGASPQGQPPATGHSHGPNPCAAVLIDNSSNVSSSRSWGWADCSQSQDPSSFELIPSIPEEVEHWVWDSSNSSAMPRGLHCPGQELERRAPDARGADLPRFDDRLDIPEYFPGAGADGGQPDKLPISKSVKRKRQRKLNERRRDMIASNQSMVGAVVDAVCALSPPWIDEVRRRLHYEVRATWPTPSPKVMVPPPSPRWKVDRVRLDAGDGVGDDEDFDDDVSE